MNLFGIGPFELLLVLVIATIVLGPERMAQAGRTLGRLYAQYRVRWQKDVDEMTRELRRELALLQREVDEIRQTAESEIKTAQAVLENAADTSVNKDAIITDDESLEMESPPSAEIPNVAGMPIEGQDSDVADAETDEEKD
jgi:sec-independent protein translocase protein TatB